MSDETLDELRRALEWASPWLGEVKRSFSYVTVMSPGGNEWTVCKVPSRCENEAIAGVMVAAANAAPGILARLSRYEEALRDTELALADIATWNDHAGLHEPNYEEELSKVIALAEAAIDRLRVARAALKETSR